MTRLVWAKIECTVHISLPECLIKQIEPVKQSRQQVIGAYCPKIYTVQAMLKIDAELYDNVMLDMGL